MFPTPKQIPDHTAVRVALWRALHVQLDSTPHVLEDDVGLHLVNPGEDWKNRPDMNPEWTRGYRASIVARARFVEDLVFDQLDEGVRQYVILGAGLDTFAQRRLETATRLRVFEIDQPETQEWKRNRLLELGYGESEALRFVPVDFEAGDSWKQKLLASGFDEKQAAVFCSTGVSMYLTREANSVAMRQIASFARGSTLAMTFLLPLEMIEASERPQHEMVYERARAAGTPFISFFKPDEIVSFAREAGFRAARHVSRADLIEKYFTGRTDGLLPASGEEFLVATI